MQMIKLKIWFQRFYFISDSILRTMRYRDTHDTIFTTPATKTLAVPPSQFSSSVFILLLSLTWCLPGLAAVAMAGLFLDFQDLATSASFAPASVHVSGWEGLEVVFLEVACNSWRVLRRKIRRRFVGFVPGLFRGGTLRREPTAVWRRSGILVRSFLVGVMWVLSSLGTTSGYLVVVLVGSLTLALAAQSVSVERRETGISGIGGSSLSVSSEIGFVLADAASGAVSSFFFSSSPSAKFFLASSLKVISLDKRRTLSTLSLTDCSTCGTDPWSVCICSSMSWASSKAPNSSRDARFSWSIGIWKQKKLI